MNALLRQKLVPASLIFCGTCCLAFLPFVFGGCFASPGQDQEFTDHAASPIALYDWEFYWGDAPVDARGIPVWTYEAMPADFWQPIRSVEVPEGYPPFAWIRIRLPEHLPGSVVVATDVIATSFEAYVDSVRIYRFGTLRPDPASKYALATAQVIPLPDGAAGRTLYLRVYSQYADFFGSRSWARSGSRRRRPLCSMSCKGPRACRRRRKRRRRDPPATAASTSTWSSYMEQFLDCLDQLQQVRYLVADGEYARKKPFETVTGQGKHLVTKLRSEAKLDFHFNMSLSAVNLARLEMSRQGISFNSYRPLAYKRFLVLRLFEQLGLASEFDLNHPGVQEVLQVGRMAA